VRRFDLLDPASERDLADAAALETEYWREVLGPDEPEFPPAEVLHGLLRVTRPDIEATGVLAREHERAVGVLVIDIRSGHGNEHMAWLPELYVSPDARRRGTGTALLDAGRGIARAADRSLIIGCDWPMSTASSCRRGFGGPPTGRAATPSSVSTTAVPTSSSTGSYGCSGS
jgi:GNAT superfamily N-acetyltransferase